MKLYVICGHGASDPGACGNGFQEAERVRILGARIKALGGDNVILGDVSRNFYKDNGISNLDIPKDYQIIELHMDSASATARGAHVIIDAKANADAYDIDLSECLSRLFPGRSQTIVKRNDLANPARAYAMGYGYRLVEIGFISNADDVAVFNANIDTIAVDILGCFGFGAQGNPEPTPQPTPEAPSTPSASLNYSEGTPVCVEQLNTQSNGGELVSSHIEGVIGRVIQGATYPYRVDRNGTPVGWVNDAIIDADPHIPGATQPSTPQPSPMKVGDWVGVKTGAKDYNGNNAGGVVKGKVYYTLDELKGDRAVLDIPGICTAFNINDLFK